MTINKNLDGNFEDALIRFNIQRWQIEEGEIVVRTFSKNIQKAYNDAENVLVYSYYNVNSYTRYCVLVNNEVFLDSLTLKELEEVLINHILIGDNEEKLIQ